VQAIKRRDAIDVDDDGRAEDAQVEHGHQALAARQHPAVLPGISKKMQGFVQLTRGVVVEPSRLHVLLNLISIETRAERWRRLPRVPT
jgi:hypothetical protein